MSKPIIFNIEKEEVIESNSYKKERNLQKIVENYMHEIFDVIFLASEFSFNDAVLGKGRIDSIGIDSSGRPVIFEYKLNENENLINQALFYMDWLKNHQADFELLVIERMGESKKRQLLPEDSKNNLLKNPRAICIAHNFNRYDKRAINQMNVDIELFQYYVYGKNLELIAFELVNIIDNSFVIKNNKNNESNKDLNEKTYIQNIYENLDESQKKLVNKIIFDIQSISDDISLIWMEKHANFKATVKNFASLVINKKDGIKISLSIDYDEDKMKQYQFIRDVKEIGHYGNGNVEAKIKNEDELNIFMTFVRESYERNS